MRDLIIQMLKTGAILQGSGSNRTAENAVVGEVC
jgi:hypothetical protein